MIMVPVSNYDVRNVGLMWIVRLGYLEKSLFERSGVLGYSLTSIDQRIRVLCTE